jgi:hypothetical protein
MAAQSSRRHPRFQVAKNAIKAAVIWTTVRKQNVLCVASTLSVPLYYHRLSICEVFGWMAIYQKLPLLSTLMSEMYTSAGTCPSAWL